MPELREERKSTPNLGTIMLQSDECLTNPMKLMGAPRLFEIVGASAAARGASSALCAELDAGIWRSPAEVAAAFPRADWEDGRLVVSLDDRLCAVIAFNYESEIALIEFAGRSVDRKELPAMRQRMGL